MLFQMRARLDGALKKVMGESDRLREGSVISTLSSERNWRRLALKESVPKSKRRFNPPSESMDWVTSRGSKEFLRRKSVLDTKLAETRSEVRSSISQLWAVLNASSLLPSSRQYCR